MLSLILLVISCCSVVETKNDLISLPLSQCSNEDDCNNQGACIGLKHHPICLCKAGFMGSRCESKMCTSKECSNRGICAGDSNNFTCLCEPGFKGNQCQEPTKQLAKSAGKKKRSLLGWMLPCSPSDCNYRGLCIGTGLHHFCLCFLGFTGSACGESVFDAISPERGGLLNVIRICSPEDCSNKGLCLGTKALPTCLCQLGYYGSNCEKPIFSMCEHADCNNNGMCIGSKKLFTCVCHNGYKGRRCERSLGIPCDSADCSFQGVCIGVKGHETCICNFGFSGRHCELKLGTDGVLSRSTDLCEVRDCNYNGLCIGNKANPVCLCNLGYTGLRCEIEPLCNSQLQCSGHGICLGTQKSYICSCSLGWIGSNCQYPTAG